MQIFGTPFLNMIAVNVTRHMQSASSKTNMRFQLSFSWIDTGLNKEIYSARTFGLKKNLQKPACFHLFLLCLFNFKTETALCGYSADLHREIH
jgi:hypothetical protein